MNTGIGRQGKTCTPSSVGIVDDNHGIVSASPQMPAAGRRTGDKQPIALRLATS